MLQQRKQKPLQAARRVVQIPFSGCGWLSVVLTFQESQGIKLYAWKKPPTQKATVIPAELDEILCASFLARYVRDTCKYQLLDEAQLLFPFQSLECKIMAIKTKVRAFVRLLYLSLRDG